MNEINFIPEQYRRRQQRRRQFGRQFTLIAVAVACLAGWAVFQNRQTAELRRYARTVEAQVDAERGRLKQLKTLNSRHDKLMNQVRLQERLAQPLSHTRILSSLSTALPDSIAMTNLAMVTQRPRNGGKKTEKDSVLAIASHAAPMRIRMQFEALAPDDMTVANLVATLSEHPIFSNVSMRRSRTVEHRGRKFRHIRIELDVDLQRRFELIEKQKGGLAHAAG